uniref:Phosphohydrolase n=1 Tax=viral metagenome TaxID=1070528 RepID=A0A6M3KS52_9ZZZZ
MSTREWFPTYTGLKFYPLKPDPKKIQIEDIAHQLSLTCRFGGATWKMSSVAQHSVLVSMHLEREGYGRENSLWGLLHDAAEAYIGDMKMGMKDMFPGFRELEDSILQVIIERYGLPWPMPKIVHEWDWIIGCNEAFTFIKGGSPKFYGVKPVRKVYMSSWEPEFAERVFLERFEILKST